MYLNDLNVSPDFSWIYVLFMIFFYGITSVSYKDGMSVIVQIGPSPSQKNKTLVLEKSRTLKSPSKPPPPITATENF